MCNFREGTQIMALKLPLHCFHFFFLLSDFCSPFFLYLKQKPHNNPPKAEVKKSLEQIITNKNAKSPKQQTSSSSSRNSSHKIPFIRFPRVENFLENVLIHPASFQVSQITRNPFVRVNALVENAEKEIIWPFGKAEMAEWAAAAYGRGLCHMWKIARISPGHANWAQHSQSEMPNAMAQRCATCWPRRLFIIANRTDRGRERKKWPASSVDGQQRWPCDVTTMTMMMMMPNGWYAKPKSRLGQIRIFLRLL